MRPPQLTGRQLPTLTFNLSSIGALAFARPSPTDSVPPSSTGAFAIGTFLSVFMCIFSPVMSSWWRFRGYQLTAAQFYKFSNDDIDVILTFIPPPLPLSFFPFRPLRTAPLVCPTFSASDSPAYVARGHRQVPRVDPTRARTERATALNPRRFL
ncbi:hypothetical protein FB45DRAFT_506128 [Roridomyces roridus]|uniref:Uncharacterized protein n=1 Tax=Roridomyces roridus TaxID=1738132 RepID=A0AAD7FPV4_9AGAR|nr:hypothetical protein FB45DRAFT_506128 [Roridomyces roridus]